jgi:nucleotide-binding universal stress UspA family protein
MLVLSPSRHSPRSIDLALSMVQTSKRPLLAVFVMDMKVPDAIADHIVDIGFLGDKVSDQLESTIHREYESRGRRELEEVKERARGLGIVCETMVRKGDFVEEILKIAEEKAIEDMVVSRAERSNLSRKLFGSAVNELLSRATFPIMVVSDTTVESHKEPGGGKPAGGGQP